MIRRLPEIAAGAAKLAGLSILLLTFTLAPALPLFNGEIAGQSAQDESGPEDFDWGLDSGPGEDKDNPGAKKQQPSKQSDAVPAAMRRTVAGQYVEFRNQRLRKNRQVSTELLRVIDAPLKKVYASLVLPRRTLKRARGRIELGIEELLVKISRRMKSNQRVARVRIERAQPGGGQGNVLIHTPGPDGGNLDPIFFVYRVKDDGRFESDVIFRPGS